VVQPHEQQIGVTPTQIITDRWYTYTNNRSVEHPHEQQIGGTPTRTTDRW
jgi:hypothetical protein